MRINNNNGGGLQSPASLYKSILIAIPSKDSWVSFDFTTSLLQTVGLFQQKGWHVAILGSVDNCFIGASRSKMAAKYLHSNHNLLFQIDDDMGWEPRKAVEMVELDLDFVAAVGNFKEEKPRYAVQQYTDDQGYPLSIDSNRAVHGNEILWAKGVGGAFTMIKRSVFEKIMDKFPHLKCNVFDEEKKKYGYAFYHTSFTLGDHRTEDQNFCDLVNSVGVKLAVYPDMTFKHQGTKSYEGNYKQYLMNLPTVGKEPTDQLQDMMNTIKNMEEKHVPTNAI